MTFSKLATTMLVAATVILAASLVSAKKPKHFELEGYTFEKYVKDFNKPYPRGSQELAARKALFEAELKDVMAHNADASQSWKKGVNQFSDWTAEEKAQRLRGWSNGVKARYGRGGSSKNAASRHQQQQYKLQDRPLPLSVDWRNSVPPVLTAVKDQGQCGSCWAHAATESIETAWAQATGQLFVLSQQQISSCTPNPDECGGTGGCGGGIAELAIDYISEVGGINQEWSYPYKSYFGTNYACSFWKNLSMVRTTGYVAVTPNSKDAALNALAFSGPLAISVDASQWSSYESGVYNGCSYKANISMDHAVQAVGYRTDPDTGKQVLIVRNSWSPAWGDNGFIMLDISGAGAGAGQPGCGWNVDPQNGNGCKGQTAPQWACGMCGCFFDTLFALPNTA